MADYAALQALAQDLRQGADVTYVAEQIDDWVATALSWDEFRAQIAGG